MLFCNEKLSVFFSFLKRRWTLHLRKESRKCGWNHRKKAILAFKALKLLYFPQSERKKPFSFADQKRSSWGRLKEFLVLLSWQKSLFILRNTENNKSIREIKNLKRKTLTSFRVSSCSVDLSEWEGRFLWVAGWRGAKAFPQYSSLSSEAFGRIYVQDFKLKEKPMFHEKFKKILPLNKITLLPLIFSRFGKVVRGVV